MLVGREKNKKTQPKSPKPGESPYKAKRTQPLRLRRSFFAVFAVFSIFELFIFAIFAPPPASENKTRIPASQNRLFLRAPIWAIPLADRKNRANLRLQRSFVGAQMSPGKIKRDNPRLESTKKKKKKNFQNDWIQRGMVSLAGFFTWKCRAELLCCCGLEGLWVFFLSVQPCFWKGIVDLKKCL